MAEEKPKVKSLKLKSKESGGSELLKSAVKRPGSEKGTPDRNLKEKVLSKGKEALTTPGSKDPVRSSSSFGKSLVKVAKEFAKSSDKDGKVSVKQEQRPSDAKSPIKKDGRALVKEEVRTPIKKASVKEEVKSPIKKEVRASVKEEVKLPIKKEVRASVKDEVKPSSKEGKGKGNANGKEQGSSAAKDAGKVNGKEQGKIQEVGKTNGKSPAGVKGKDEDREKEKGKSSVAKSPLAKTPVKKLESASKMSPQSTAKAGASPSVGVSVKKKVMKSTTTTVATTKTVTEAKKEKKVYELPGQKHDPPEERDPLRVFYSTLREQLPESEMAEIWLMEYGLLPPDEAQKAFERKQKKTQGSKQGPSSKVSTPSRLSNGSPGVKKSTPVSNGKGVKKSTPVSNAKNKKKRASSDSESDSDDDFLQNVVTKNKKKLKT